MRVFKFTLAILFATVAFAGMAWADCGMCGNGGGHAACAGKGECAIYNKASATTFKGKVVSIDKEKCKGCDMTHVDLVVKMKDENVTVRLGPAWYIDRQDELLKKDDVIEIFASKVDGEQDDFFVAGKIVKGDDVLMLRDENGRPMWKGWRRNKV